MLKQVYIASQDVQWHMYGTISSGQCLSLSLFVLEKSFLKNWRKKSKHESDLIWREKQACQSKFMSLLQKSFCDVLMLPKKLGGAIETTGMLHMVSYTQSFWVQLNADICRRRIQFFFDLKIWMDIFGKDQNQY